MSAKPLFSRLQAPPGHVILGELLSPHGIAGAIKVRSYTQNSADLFCHIPLYTHGLTITSWDHWHTLKKDMFLARCRDLGTTREALERWRHHPLWVARHQLPDAPQGHIYYADLIGQSVHDPQGNLWGQVAHMHNFGAGDIVEILVHALNDTVFMALCDLQHDPSGMLVGTLPDTR